MKLLLDCNDVIKRAIGLVYANRNVSFEARAQRVLFDAKFNQVFASIEMVFAVQVRNAAAVNPLVRKERQVLSRQFRQELNHVQFKDNYNGRYPEKMVG